MVNKCFFNWYILRSFEKRVEISVNVIFVFLKGINFCVNLC